jgi:cell division septation protein DedD
MDNENGRVRERIELSLDGRQIASIVVGGLVLLGVVFVVGFNLGKNVAVRQFEATRGDALAALDRPPPQAGTPTADDALTFHDRLTKEKAPADDLSARTPAAPSVPAPAPAPAAAAGPAPATPASAKGVVAPAAKPPGAPAARSGPGTGAFTVQLISTPNRAEADKLAARLQEFDPRVEEAEVKDKGRYYRVRAGSFETRAEADRLLKAIASRTGGKGLVVSTGSK